MRKGKFSLALLAAVTMVTACAGRPPLVTKATDVPEGVDLSGQWQLLTDAEADMRRPMSEDIKVDVFLRTGKSLKLTQTAHGLFVSFDRSVVEEYRFGENRMVNVGPVECDRASGWVDGAYVIETRDEEGAILLETYRLGDAGRRMTRTVTIVYVGNTEYELRQVFERS